MSEFEIVPEPASVTARRELEATVERFAIFCLEHRGEWVRYPRLHSGHQIQIITASLGGCGIETETEYWGGENNRYVIFAMAPKKGTPS